MAALLLVSSLSAATLWAQPPSGADIDSSQAEAALEAGRFVDAEGLFRQLMASQPWRIDAYLGLSRALAGQDRKTEASRLLTDLAEQLLQMTQDALAVDVLSEAVLMDPDSARVYALLGRAQALAQDSEAARLALARAIELGDTSVATWLFYGSVQWELGDLDGAEKAFRELLASAPGTALPPHQVGRLLVWQGRYEEGLPYLVEAARMSPDSADLALDLGRALEGAGKYEEAIAAYRQVVELAPDQYRTYYNLALLLGRQGDRQAAAEAMERYRQLYEVDKERTRRQGLERARLDRGWELLGLGEIEAALEQFEGLSESSETLAGRASAYAASGRHTEAVGALERAVILAPERQDLRMMLAQERLAMEKTP